MLLVGCVQAGHRCSWFSLLSQNPDNPMKGPPTVLSPLVRSLEQGTWLSGDLFFEMYRTVEQPKNYCANSPIYCSLQLFPGSHENGSGWRQRSTWLRTSISWKSPVTDDISGLPQSLDGHFTHCSLLSFINPKTFWNILTIDVYSA
jgi:hypothetical protein